jgi:hypothetical protein
LFPLPFTSPQSREHVFTRCRPGNKDLGGCRLCPPSVTLIAEAPGDVDVQYVWRSQRKQTIDLGGRKSWCENKDPESPPRPRMWSGST